MIKDLKAEYLSAPKAPSKSQLLLASNATQLTLDLTTYSNQGCPITSFHITCTPMDRIKSGSKKSRRSTSRNSGDDSSFIRELELDGTEKLATLRRLQPKAWYLIEVVAKNSAGKTATTYKMATLTLSGGELFLTKHQSV